MRKSTPRRASVVGEYIIKSGSKINCAAIGNTSCGVFCTGDDSKNVCIWAMQSQMPIKVLGGHNSEISSIIFSRDEKYAFAGTVGGSIHMWDLESQKIVLSLKEHRNSCNCLAVPQSPLTAVLASGSQDTNVKIWDLRTGKSSHTFRAHEGPVNSVCFAPSGQWIGAGGDDGTIKIWGIQNAKIIADLKFGDSPVVTTNFNPVFCTLASSTASKAVRYWDMEKFSLISESPLDTSPARKLAFMPDGKYLISAHTDSLKFWKLDALRLVDVKELPSRKTEDIAVSETEACVYICSSFAHSLGIYSVPFETINFEVPHSPDPTAVVSEYNKPPMFPPEQKMDIDPPVPPTPFQCNIVTTKPEAGKKPAISTAQNQINPMLVANAMPRSLEESGTIVQKPSDKPINLDMNAFLGETQKTKKDIDIINDLKKDHTSIMAIVNKRLGHVSLIQNYWNRGDITSALSAMNMINDPSVTMDVFNSTFADGFSLSPLTLDHAIVILPLALGLVKAKYDCYIQTGIRTIENIFKKFADGIKSARSVPVFAGVDLAREERLKKGETCLDQFKVVLEDPIMRKIADKSSELGKLGRRIMTDLEFFLKSCGK